MKRKYVHVHVRADCYPCRKPEELPLPNISLKSVLPNIYLLTLLRLRPLPTGIGEFVLGNGGSAVLADKRYSLFWNNLDGARRASKCHAILCRFDIRAIFYCCIDVRTAVAARRPDRSLPSIIF